MKVNEQKLEDIPIVRNFPSVFLEDLPGLPSFHEDEFHIDLVPEAMAIAKITLPFGTYGNARTNAKPLTLLAQKDKKYEWGDEHENAFQTLKDMLCDAPILSLLEGTGKANVVADALSRKERLKPRRARAMSMTIHSSIKTRILEAQSEASKGVNTLAEIGHDLIWVMVDRLTKSAHFLANREDYKMEIFVRLYLNKIVARHGTRLDMSTAYHPRTDGQSKCTIQTLEDMHTACAIDFEGNWDTHLPLVELSYYNSYHSSVKCALFEAMYGRKCQTPIAWAEVGEKQAFT
nr:putative reverse transcriptase domain-containing protein [Tanacetum cinerariifolium]